MVYGFRHAKYERISQGHERAPGSPFSKVFDYNFGNAEKPEYCVTLEGTAIEEFPADRGTTTRHKCKAAVTNLVLENFKRQKLGHPLIPLLFCVESPDTPEKHKLTVQSLTTKEWQCQRLLLPTANFEESTNSARSSSTTRIRRRVVWHGGSTDAKDGSSRKTGRSWGDACDDKCCPCLGTARLE